MSTIYIAGKITNFKAYKDTFSKAENRLNSEGNLCMNPSILPEGFPWEAYMPICFAMIDACDCMYMLRNWVDSRGAKVELDYAKSTGKRIRYEEDEE